MNDKALAIIPSSLDEVSELAERLAKSTLLPKGMQGKVPDVLVTIMAGAEMGLAPMASLRAIHVIEGKPVLSADGMVAIVLGSGKAQYFDRTAESDTSVTYETMRVGSKTPRSCTWTMDQAKRAGLNLKDNWRAYPRAMLASRAKAELARDVFPDVLAGCYTDDEIERTAHPPALVRDDVQDAEVIDGAAESIAEIEAAATVDDLSAVAKVIAKRKLRGAARDQANAAYGARLAALNTAPVEATA